MRRIRIHPPSVSGSVATFSWDVHPRTLLYRKHSFSLRFPMDVSHLPDSVWARIAMICLHPHWLLLRPCRVELPFHLESSEIEFWHRMLDATLATLESSRPTPDLERRIEFVCQGPRLMPFEPLPPSDRCATAFSGGKDSLLQTGLLTEFTDRPVLVTTTSRLPPFNDHATDRRHHVFRSIAERRPVEHIEVVSDYRSHHVNFFPRLTRGYRISVNELTDTYLYFSALLCVGLTLQVPHLFLASEAEVQENAMLDGRIVMHQHFMYSTVVQRSLQALLRGLGIQYSSLTSPLHGCQVQELLWRRYPDLRDLQYSCWRMQKQQATCSRCRMCLKIAFGALALGEDPQTMGIDLARLLTSQRRWAPRPPSQQRLPRAIVSKRVTQNIARDIQRSSPEYVEKILSIRPPGMPRFWHRIRSGRAWAAYHTLRQAAMTFPVGPPPGYRPGFVDLIDARLRDRVAQVFARSFPAEDESRYGDIRRRTDELAAWIAEPLESPVSAPGSSR